MKRKSIISSLKNFYFYNIRLSYKLLISYWLLLAIPTIAVSIFLYGEIYDIVIANTIRSEQLIAEQSVGTVEATIRQIANTANMISSDSYLSNLFALENRNTNENTISSVQHASFLKSVVSSIDDTVIKDIKIYVDTPYEALCPDNTTFLPIAKAKGTYWYGIMNNSNDTVLHCPSFYLSPTEMKNYGNMAFIKKINSGSSAENPAAYLVIYYNQNTLNDILRLDQTVSNSVTYIINNRNNITAASDIALAGTYYMNYTALETEIGQSDTFTLRTVLEQQVYISYYPIYNTDWRLVSVIPARPLIHAGRAFMFNFLLLYLIFLAVAFALAVALSHSIAKRISLISKGMQSVRSGKLLPIDESQAHGTDEVGSLADTYNYMVGKINELMEAQSVAAEQLRTSEFNALQAQINPHFLYNTLDMINWLSQSGQSKDVTEAVQNLSRFYKLTLSKKDTISRIEEELEHVTLYVRLQNMRYQNKINFLIDVPDELMDYEIPKLTFQPIVENAIQHGILERESKEGSIVLTAWTENKDIVFLISDNGMGMSEENLASVLDGNGKSKHGSNIGVYNTHQRLLLLYGEAYGLHYDSTPGIGTEVLIRIPASIQD